MRKPHGWFEWVKLAASIALWSLMLGFIGHWIYGFDACRRASSSASPQVGCFLSSLVSTYFAWLAYALKIFLDLVTLVL